MDKNTIIGFVLMFVLLMGYNWYTAPTEEEIAEMERLAEIESANFENSEKTHPNDEGLWSEDGDGSVNSALLGNNNISGINLPANDSLGKLIISKEVIDKYGPFAPSIYGKNKEYSIASYVLDVKINSRGGLPTSATLIDGNVRYGDGEPIELWDTQRSYMDIQFDVPGTGRLKMSELNFLMTSVTDTTMYLKTVTESGGSIEIVHTLNGYQLDTRITFRGLDKKVLPEQHLIWSATGLRNEKGLQWERQHTSIFYKEEGRGRDYLSEGRSDEEVIEYDLEWVDFKQDFFSAIVSRDGGFEVGAVLTNELFEDDTTSTLSFNADLPMIAEVRGNTMEHELSFYFGPNDLELLNNTGLEEAGRIIDYGWWIFGWVNRNFILPIYDFLNSRIASAGLIILIITLIIKMFLFPITWKNFLSSAKMKMLRPDIEKINEEHKDDSTARQQATMELYRKTGVNPMAGCLPALLQMPILYAMFRFFPANIDLRGKSFLWADDLAAYDSIIDLPFSIPMYGSHISGFTVLMAISIFFYMRMTTANQPPQVSQPGMPNMKVIQNFIPFTMLFFFNKFASGLSLYYLAANLVSIGQMLIIKRYFINEDKILAKIDANVKNPKKKSAFQERLAEMQKEQVKKTKDLKAAKDKRKKK
ncbi:MAG: membrane protein insertase YidC [Bacteroidetes bacterium]|nr:MAG: membrane protein insertase YidC [Bacteroidota bacterium]